MTGWIDAHHHLWDLTAVNYPWLMAKGVERFFGDPTPIQRNYLLPKFRGDAGRHNISASVHIQVGAEDGLAEAQWVQAVADATSDWTMVQVVFCDLTDPQLSVRLDAFQTLSTVRGVRQIVGRAPGEDAVTGTNDLLDNPRFVAGLREAGRRGLSFDLQLIPELMDKTATVLERAPQTKVALCHAGSPHDRSSAGLSNWGAQLNDCPPCTRSPANYPALVCSSTIGASKTSAPLSKPVLNNSAPSVACTGQISRSTASIPTMPH